MNRKNLVLATLLAALLIGGTGWYVSGQDLDLYFEPVKAGNPDLFVEPDIGSSTSWGGDTDFAPGRRRVPLVGPRKELQALEQAALRLTQEYVRTTESNKRTQISSNLSNIVEKEFDARQQGRAKELDELEKQLERLREIHERRERERQRIISDRVQQLLRDADGLGWGPSEPSKLRGDWQPFGQPDDPYVPGK